MIDDITTLEDALRHAVPPKLAGWSWRLVGERHEWSAVRRGVAQPPESAFDLGAMLTVWTTGGGCGYAATPDLTPSGLARCASQALEWARRTEGRLIAGVEQPIRLIGEIQYESPAERPWPSVGMREKIEVLEAAAAGLTGDTRIVDWEASLWLTEVESLLVSAEGRAHQRFSFVVPDLRATANAAAESQTRTLGGRGCCRQAGFELLDAIGFVAHGPRIAEEALELLAAPECPNDTRDLLLAPDQMVLQIHESIGHPLEIDRILGDERNYAGRSFVTPEMIGHYQYGSALLDIVFDPTVSGEFASYAIDDEGTPAQRVPLIQNGVLVAALGGATSQRRSGIPGTANARASSWKRPPIDRMANLNLEPGDSTLDAMIGRVERGVFMESNCSWSIDDSRNKFQFSCERGQLIENGVLGAVVKNPGYRGRSATFWRSLTAVGDAETCATLGTPHCGKGEPNQGIRVGHASPACLFGNVDVLGGILMQNYFEQVAHLLEQEQRGAEIFTAYFEGESSDFVRFNAGRVRQAGSVEQRALSIDWINGLRHARSRTTLTGSIEADTARLHHQVAELRERSQAAPEDPHLLYAQRTTSRTNSRPARLPDANEATTTILESAGHDDLVGIYAAGALHTGFASSFGQREWSSAQSFHFDWSLHGGPDRAVKESYAGFEWDGTEIERREQSARERLALLERPLREVAPGRYRVYLAPAALDELVDLLAWGGFGARAHQTRTTPLIEMIAAGRTLDEQVHFTENTEGGIAPSFQASGFERPPIVPLIRAGRYADCLVSPRTAAEFDLQTNGADESEMPNSFEIGAGDLAADRALAELGTGIYISNLWYMNYSDRSSCRTTGMTRFATFWVENGTLVEPMAPMRFDESLYRAFGDQLVGFTAERDWILDAGTYGGRSRRSKRLPGALIDDWTFTL